MTNSIKPDKCPKCGGELWSVEYSLLSPEHYDGTSEWACKNALKHDDADPTCTFRMGRFCGKILAPGEIEPRYCGGGTHPLVA